MVQMLKTRKQVARIVAHTNDARDGVNKVGEYRVRIAEQVLAQGTHGAAPHAYITSYMGKTDYYIVLNDERGTKSALTIEFGRRGGNLDKNGRPVTPSRAVAPIRRAVGLA